MKGVQNAGTKKKNIEVKKRNAQVTLETEKSPDGVVRSLRSAGHAPQGMPGVRLL